MIACLPPTLVGIGALARARPAARGEHAGVRHRGADLHLPAADPVARPARPCAFPASRSARSTSPNRNRAYYYFTLAVLVLVLVVVGHLRRSGIGRTIIGVRENEQAAAALTVSPTRAKLTAFALGGFIAGLGGALLGGLVVTIGYAERFFRVDDSLQLVAMAVIGGLGSLAGAVIGALWVVGPARRSGPTTTSCRCSRRASGC